MRTRPSLSEPPLSWLQNDINLPRQARDKHRKSSFILQNDVNLPRQARVGTNIGKIETKQKAFSL